MKKFLAVSATMFLAVLTPSFSADTVKLDQTIDGSDMDLVYTSTVSNVASIEDLVNGGYVEMYYPSGKQVPFDTTGNKYTFMSYINNVSVKEYATSYRVTFGFATSLSGDQSTDQYGSFIVTKDTDTTGDHEWETLTPTAPIVTPQEPVTKLDQTIDGSDMDLVYTSTVSNVASIEDLVNGGYVEMYYPSGKQVPFDTTGNKYTFMSYINNVSVKEYATSYRVTFGFATSLSGDQSTDQYGSFIIEK